MSTTAERFEHRNIDAGGINTHFLESGDPVNDTVILLHGGGAGADAYGNWRGIIGTVAEHYHVIAMDMVGFGETDKPNPTAFSYSQTRRNEHLADFIDALGVGAAHLVGNSMGGATALGVAVDRPSLVKRLVLMGSAGLNAELSPALMPIVQYDFTEEGMERLIGALTGDDFRASADLVRYRHQLSIQPDTKAAYGAIMGWIRDQGGLYYDESYIAKVQAETLVVNGKDDLVVPVENANRFLELIPNSWGYFIPHCGHWAMMEASADFCSAMLAFLRRP